MAESAVRAVPGLKIDTGCRSDEQLWVSVEEPLEIQLVQPSGERQSVAVTMRTPGGEYELAVGFLLTEAIIQSLDELGPMPLSSKLQTTGTNNVCVIQLKNVVDLSPLKRNFYGTSSCGVCGKASIDQIEKVVRPMPVNLAERVRVGTLVLLPERLREAQAQFALTGGLHAVGLFDFSGTLLIAREDVGRHNAMDKVIGAALIGGQIPSPSRIAMASGRLSFELVQKAALAGITVLCAVSAPSSLAISAADRFGITLVGFVREQRVTVFTHSERIEA
jgi:FdhD protein